MAAKSNKGRGEVVPKKLVFTRGVSEASFVKTLPTDTHRSHVVHIYVFTLEEILHPAGMPIKLGMELPLRSENLEFLIKKEIARAEY